MKLSTYLMYDISGNNIGTLFKITILKILANGKLLICQYKRKEYQEPASGGLLCWATKITVDNFRGKGKYSLLNH